VKVQLGWNQGESGGVVRHRYADLGPWQGPPHRHDEWECNLVLKGRARVLLGERSYDLVPGALLWLLPGKDHYIGDQSTDFDMWVGIFRSSLVKEAFGKQYTVVQAELKCQGGKQLAADEVTSLSVACREAGQALEGKQTAEAEACLTYLLVAGYRLFRQASASWSFRDVHPAVAKAAAELCRNPSCESLESLGSQVGLSSGRLSRLFHLQVGIPLIQYRSRERLKQFFLCYGTGEVCTLTEAAYAAGFSSYLQFYRVFRAQMGVSPRAYFR
jgi:AraC-like DNA-binding protein